MHPEEIETMATTVKVGTIFVQNRPLILRTLGLESEPYEGTWDVLHSLPNVGLDQEIRSSGWNYFFIGAEVRASVFGRLTARRVRRALEQIFAKVRDADFNCLEVTEIIEKRYLGIPYITMCAHSRHIQQGSMMDFARASATPKPLFVSSY
jgi:hypothetical protein